MNERKESQDHLAAPSGPVPSALTVDAPVYSDRVKCKSCEHGSGPNGCTDCLNTGHDPQAFAGGIDEALNDAYAEGRKDEAQERAWQPIETAPEDENVLVATQGGYVDTAFWTNEDGEGRVWWWLESANKYAPHPIDPKLVPTHWMPLPKHPEAA